MEYLPIYCNPINCINNRIWLNIDQYAYQQLYGWPTVPTISYSIRNYGILGVQADTVPWNTATWNPIFSPYFTLYFTISHSIFNHTLPYFHHKILDENSSCSSPEVGTDIISPISFLKTTGYNFLPLNNLLVSHLWILYNMIYF